MNVREQFETNKKFLEYERDEQAFLLFVFVFVVREPYLIVAGVSMTMDFDGLIVIDD